MIRVCNLNQQLIAFFFMYLPFPNCVYRAGTKVLILKKRIILTCTFIFFLTGFSFTKIHDSRDSRGRERVSI